jgi:hypothetical protein
LEEKRFFLGTSQVTSQEKPCLYKDHHHLGWWSGSGRGHFPESGWEGRQFLILATSRLPCVQYNVGTSSKIEPLFFLGDPEHTILVAWAKCWSDKVPQLYTWPGTQEFSCGRRKAGSWACQVLRIFGYLHIWEKNCLFLLSISKIMELNPSAFESLCHLAE